MILIAFTVVVLATTCQTLSYLTSFSYYYYYYYDTLLYQFAYTKSCRVCSLDSCR